MFKKITAALIALIMFFSVSSSLPRLEFKDAALPDVIELLSKKAGMDVIFSGDSGTLRAKRVDLDLSNSTPIEAIENLLRANGLSFERKEKTLIVSTLPEDAQESAYEQETRSLKLKHVPAQKMSELIEKLFPKLKSLPSLQSNTLILKGKKERVNEARELIKKLDYPTPQVLIESQVIEVSESGSQKLGLLFGKNPGNFTFITDKNTGDTRPAEDLISTLKALMAQGKAYLKANPRIATLDGHEALINIGSRIPYAVPYTSSSGGTQWSVDYIDAGVKLKITPRIGEDGMITSFIQPEVSSISEWRTTSAGDFPVISTRNAQATLRVKNGETIVVGGLISEAQRENIIRIPILGHLPLVGLLFQDRVTEKMKNEVIFLITPYLL